MAELPIEPGKEERIRYAVAQALMALLMETEKYYRYSPFYVGWWRNILVSSVLFRRAFKVFKKGG